MDLLKAIETNNKVVVLSALHSGYNVNSISFGSSSPLVYAVILNCDLPILQVLIENGSDLDDALVAACSSEYFDAFKLILEAGGNVNAVNKSNFPLIHLASLKGEKYLRILLLHGGNPNALCPLNRTPLHYSIAERCESSVISLLLQFKADLSIRNQDGVNAEEFALSTDAYEAVALIRKAKKSTTTTHRRSSARNKENTDHLSDFVATLNKAERRLKCSQKTLEQQQKKLEKFGRDFDASNKQCIALRKNIAKCITGENLDEGKTQKSGGVKRKLQFECPICFNDFDVNTKIYQCPEGHLLCDTCKQNKNMQTFCPQCHCVFPEHNIRNRALENIVAECNNKL